VGYAGSEEILVELREIAAMQRAFDAAHGWTLEDGGTSALLEALSDDIVGLTGELGEFANLVKKLKLRASRNEELATSDLRGAHPALREELADIFIYLVRLAEHLSVDLENEYLAKLEKNRERHADFELDRD
jgi:NTP pyrophosphatase (non-canonical NTP hydrolase)